MQTRTHNRNKKSLTSIISLLIAQICFSAFAHETTSKTDATMSLKSVMFGLLENTQKISQGIFLENFEMIETAAKKIAHHPGLNEHSMHLLKSQLKNRMKNFKQYDHSVHQSAVTIYKASLEKDMTTIFSEYHKLIDGCQSCHNDFKSEMTEAFKNNIK